MSPKEKKFKVTVDYPSPDIEDEKKKDLEEKMRNTLVSVFPEASDRDEVMILARPKVR